MDNYSVCNSWCTYCSHSYRSANRTVSCIPKPIKVLALYSSTASICKLCMLCSHGRFDVEDINQDILTSESPSGTLRTARSNSFSYQKVSHTHYNKKHLLIRLLHYFQENKDTSEEVDYNPIYSRFINFRSNGYGCG